MPGVLSTMLIPREWPSSKRRKGLNALSDLQAWQYTDDNIISEYQLHHLVLRQVYTVR